MPLKKLLADISKRLADKSGKTTNKKVTGHPRTGGSGEGSRTSGSTAGGGHGTGSGGSGGSNGGR